jgi:hypothetical protein
VLVNNLSALAVSGLTSAGGGDSGIVGNGTLTLDRCAVAHNSSATDGGGISNSGSLSLSNSTISDRQAPDRSDATGNHETLGNMVGASGNPPRRG